MLNTWSIPLTFAVLKKIEIADCLCSFISEKIKINNWKEKTLGVFWGCLFFLLYLSSCWSGWFSCILSLKHRNSSKILFAIKLLIIFVKYFQSKTQINKKNRACWRYTNCFVKEKIKITPHLFKEKRDFPACCIGKKDNCDFPSKLYR